MFVLSGLFVVVVVVVGVGVFVCLLLGGSLGRGGGGRREGGVRGRWDNHLDGPRVRAFACCTGHRDSYPGRAILVTYALVFF